jgi:cell division protein FtsB
MTDQVHDVLIAFAPYIAGIISAAIAYLSYRESKRKTKHDQLADLADRYAKDNDRLRRENDRLRNTIARLKGEKV